MADMKEHGQDAGPAEGGAAINRAQIEHRAVWMGLIYDELVKAGIDAEPAIRRAVRRCGAIHGAAFKAQCPDMAEFRRLFLR
ncbi:MAG: hypothetical protein LBD13_05290, partial [Spirochaetaceae bacterium]|nr:hypothetical protein [Spirochaetaceae bacterium]